MGGLGGPPCASNFGVCDVWSLPGLAPVANVARGARLVGLSAAAWRCAASGLCLDWSRTGWRRSWLAVW